jgi:uncharacterized protein (DUF58 family)
MLRDETTLKRTTATGQPLLVRIAAALHYDFCPWANWWVYWLKNPLGSLMLATITAVFCGTCINTNVLILAGVLAGILTLGIIWPWLSLRGVRCELSFDEPRVREGHPVAASLRVHNRCPWPAWGLVLERGLPSSDGGTASIALARVAGWTSCELIWEFVPARRGVYPLEPLELATRFPFGLFRAAIRAVVGRELIVWPRTVPLESLPDTVEIDPRDERYSDRHAGDAGEVLGTRAFRQGDSLRRVHWTQSARHQRLIVCERQASASCALSLSVDLDASSYADSGPESLEQVIRIAASLCESLHRLHADVECRIGHESFLLSRSGGNLRRLMDHLARVPQTGYRIESAAKSGRCRIRSRVMISLTTDAGLARRIGQPHSNLHERLIVVQSRREIATQPTAGEGCCRPWIEFDAACDLAAELPARWRRACRVT